MLICTAEQFHSRHFEPHPGPRHAILRVGVGRRRIPSQAGLGFFLPPPPHHANTARIGDPVSVVRMTALYTKVKKYFRLLPFSSAMLS
jgi:hypothetical protein